jgi:hypothetical protein
MPHQRGAPRKLTDAQIARVLRWQAREVAFRSVHGTAQSLATRLGVNVSVVRRAVSQRSRGRAPKHRQPGRSELLTPRQRLVVRRWHAAYRHFMATRLSAAQLADALGVSRFAIFDCIRRRGRYAQLDYEKIEKARGNPRTSGDRAGSTRRRAYTAVAHRAALLRAWPRVSSHRQTPGSAHPQVKHARGSRGQ